MKIFISWSGEHSQKIAIALNEFIENVIQSTKPFVSAKDIPKGQRWSQDIAKALEHSNFGIICVTKDNIQAPWILFEAGALSKMVDVSNVVPLLFGIKPSDLKDSPLSQFQAVNFSEEDVRKLIHTVDEKNEKKLKDLDKIFDKWYPDFENEINNIMSSIPKGDNDLGDEEISKSSQMMEEILSLSRENQKLLKNSEDTSVLEIQQSIREVYEESRYRQERYTRFIARMHLLHRGGQADLDALFVIVISCIGKDFPWVYDLGKDLHELLKSNKSQRQKLEAIENFERILKYTVAFDEFGSLGELSYVLEQVINGLIESIMQSTEQTEHPSDEDSLQ